MAEGEYSFSLMGLLGDVFTQLFLSRLLLSPYSQGRCDSSPPVIPEAIWLAGVAGVCPPFPWCHSLGWGSERLGNGEHSSGQGQPRHPWDPTQPAKSYWKTIFTQLLNIWKLLKACAFLTSSFCPFSPAEN